MSKRTIDLFFRPAALAASSVPVPQSTESEDDDSEDRVAKKGRTQNFREDWLREFGWLRYCKETKSMNCECCSRYPRNAGNTKFADNADPSEVIEESSGESSEEEDDTNTPTGGASGTQDKRGPSKQQLGEEQFRRRSFRDSRQTRPWEKSTVQERGPALYLAFLQRGPALYLAFFQRGPALYLAFLQRGPALYLAFFQRGPALYLAFFQRGPALYLAFFQRGPALYLAFFQRGPALYLCRPSEGFLCRCRPPEGLSPHRPFRRPPEGFRLHSASACPPGRQPEAPCHALGQFSARLPDTPPLCPSPFIFFASLLLAPLHPPDLDATAPVRVVVALDLTPQQFHQLLRDNITGGPDEFELCRVNRQREVVPLTQQWPMDIHNHQALQRSNLYLRPKNSTSEELTMSNPTTTENVEPPGPITNPAPENELSPAIPDFQPRESVRVEPTVHLQKGLYIEDVITFSSDEELEEVLLGSPNRSDPDDNVDIKAILSTFSDMS
ncbi:unnamed protein product [Boreogadus saida]